MISRDVAIVGLACVFPGAADARTYWRNVVNGVDAIRELPAGRWPGARNTGLPADHHAHVGVSRGGFIPTPFLFDPLRFKVMPKVAREGDVDQFVLLHIIDDALADAAIGAGDPRRARTDVIVGRGGYTSNKMMEIFLRADLVDRLDRWLAGRLGEADRRALRDEILGGLPELDPDSMASSIPNLVASRAANRLDLRGASYTVDAACASSLIALEHVVRRLRAGESDVGVACGINFTSVPSFWYLFDRILAVSPTGRIAPFDRHADGMLIGEGAGAVVVKRVEDARRDGDHVYAVIKGVGSASDGAAAGVLAPSSPGQVAALEAAYADAGVDAQSIRLLEAHGTGTVQGDAAEIQTLATIWPRRSHHPTRALGSVKSMIGHTMPAAGMASLIKATLALSNRILPPTLHCREPNPALEDTSFFVNTRPRPWVHDPDEPPRRAGVNAFGFGGINAHVVLEEAAPSLSVGAETAVLPGVASARPGDEGGPEESTPAELTLRPRMAISGLHRPSELLVFSGKTPAEVVGALRRAATFVREDRGSWTMEDLAFSLVAQVAGEHACRLGVVAEPDGNPAGRLEGLARDLEAGSLVAREADGVYWSTRADRFDGQLVALFPGQGFPGLVGHYPEHLMEFCMHLPRVRRIFDRVEMRDRHPDDPVPTSYLLMPPEHLPGTERTRLRSRFGTNAPLAGVDPEAPPPTPEERGLSAMGMLVSNWVSWLVLEPFRIPFSMTCGQSLGDMSALCAAGMVDFEEIIPRLWPYLSVDDRLPGVGCLAFVGTDEKTLEPLMAEAGDVVIALHLSPETQIVGGAEDAVDRLVRALKERNVMAQKLPFPPIHTPRLTDLQQRLQEMEGEPVPLAPARLTVYSTITESPMPADVGELRSLVAGNISRPVRFWQTVRRMYDDGGRLFVQVGTGTLAGNIRAILPQDTAVTVALDVDYRHPMTQIQHLCATLFTYGVPLELRALFEATEPRLLPLDAPRDAETPRGVPLTLYWPPLHAPDDVTQASGPPAPRRGVAREPQAAGGALPLVGEILRFEAGRSVLTERVFDLDEDLFLHDHTFILPDGVKPLTECFPLLPLTMTLEMMAQVAACLAPGRGVIALENVRAREWIALDGVQRLPVRVQGRVEDDSDGVMRVQTDVLVGDKSVASAAVLLSTHYRLTVDLTFNDLDSPRPYPIAPQQLYTDRYYFHGPLFRCLGDIDALGDRGISGDLITSDGAGLFASCPSPQLLLEPVTLDGAGQMFGAIFLGQELYMLPVSVDRIELYRPSPTAGTRVPIRVEVTEFDRDTRRVAANMEVQDGEGRVWFRIRGWRDVLFRWCRELLEVQQQPTQHTLAHRLSVNNSPAGLVAVVLPRERLRDAQIERLARLYLDGSEWPAFQANSGSYRRQREWLMGRIAAKDAVRRWLAQREGSSMLHPSALVIDNDEQGRPVVRRRDGGNVPAVSLAHVQAGAAAAAADGPIGVDLEASDAGGGLEEEAFATDAEIRLLDRHAGDVLPGGRATRLWCAKEAAAKAVGTGLQGRPKAFELVRVQPDGRLVFRHGDPPGWIEVQILEDGGRIVAVAARAAGETGTGPVALEVS